MFPSESAVDSPLGTGLVDTVGVHATDGGDDGDPDTDTDGASVQDTGSEDSRVTVDSGGTSPSKGCSSGPGSEVGDFLGPDSDDSAFEAL